jgi:hypothetical protein
VPDGHCVVTDLLGGDAVPLDVEAGRLSVRLAPYGYRWFAAQPEGHEAP